MLYGFQMDCTGCVEGEKYIVCDGKLWHKQAPDEISAKIDFCKDFPLRMYQSEEGSFLGFQIARYGTRCTALPQFHQRLKNFEKYVEQAKELLEEICMDCHLRGNTFDFISVTIASQMHKNRKRLNRTNL